MDSVRKSKGRPTCWPAARTVWATMFLLTHFLTVSGQEKFGDKDFYQYQLAVHCNPNAASVIFNARSKGVMGTKTLCAGKCPGGKAERVDDVLAMLPDDVSSSFRKQLADHEAKAAEGKVTSLTPCLNGCGSRAWEDYQRDLKIVLGIWDDADAEFDRGLEEFRKASKEIVGDLATGPAQDIGEEALPWIVEQIVKKTGRAKVLIKPVAGEAASATAAGGGVVLFVAETAMTLENVRDSVNNLEYSSESQHKMRARAHEKWKQALDNLERALAEEKACGNANSKIQAKAEAERKLEEQARQYLDASFDNFHKTYRVGNKDYKDAKAALEAAKKIIEARYKGRSQNRQNGPSIQMARYSHSISGVRSTSKELPMNSDLQEAVRQLDLTESHLRRGTPLIVNALAIYRGMRKSLDMIRGRIGTGQGPQPLPSKK